MKTSCLLLTVVCLYGGVSASAAEPVEWIWAAQERTPRESICLRMRCDVKPELRRAKLFAIADHSEAVVYVNGAKIAAQQPFDRALTIDIAPALRAGENTIGVCARAVGPAALAARVELEYADGSRRTIVSDATWQTAKLAAGDGLRWPDESSATWRDAASLGAVVAHRWGLEPDSIAINLADDYTQWKRAVAGTGGTDPATFQVATGFTVELLHSAAKDEDSWVSLAPDRRGRWIIGMEKKGLLRLTLPDKGGAARVERINDTLRECRGLVFAHDALYAMANMDNALFRLRDTDGDDQFDKVERLFEFAGDAGHGRNQLTLGPDGGVWGIFGDSVHEPEDAVKLPPALARPSQEEKTRSGFAARFSADGSQVEIIVRGLRNPYGLDFNAHGEMFTYDADAEYDMGSSWYRPTRVNHLLPGGDYGWRRVTQQWPPYFPDRADMPRPTVDIGKGSPTAVEFGAGNQFPPRYRDALFALDWAYGRILAVHVTPRGASYYASAETFLRGAPLNVTDLEFGADGAMYFVTGGRGTQSALYRVRYTGPKVEPAPSTLQEHATQAQANDARTLRQKLEALVAQPDVAQLEFVWEHLGSEDPWLRHAARAALEELPADAWRGKALAEKNLDRALAARIALARSAPPTAWGEFHFAQTNESQQLEMCYLAERLLADASLDNEQRDAILAELRSSYPARPAAVNIELSRLLAEHPDNPFIAKTLDLLARAETQHERLHYLFALRHIKAGWTLPSREFYFEHLRLMDDFIGGEGSRRFAS